MCVYLVVAAAVYAECEFGAVGEATVELAAGLECVHLANGDAIDAHVDDDHDEQRYVEGDERREDQVDDVVGKDARVGRMVGGAARRHPEGDHRKRDARRADPDERDKGEPVARQRRAMIVERIGDGRVAIERYEEQRVDRRRRAEHVHRVPDVAPHVAEEPVVVGHLIQAIEGYDEQADEQIGARQRRYVVVVRRLEVVLAHHRIDHHRVAAHGHHRYEKEHHADERMIPFGRRGRRRRRRHHLAKN